MKEIIFKLMLNLVALMLIYKLIMATRMNLNQWEKAKVINFTDYGRVDDLNCTVSNVIRLNEGLSSKLEDLRTTLFFKIFKVNLDGECTYFTKNMICNFPTCAVCQCEDDEVPLPWKQETKKQEQLNTQIVDVFQKWVDKNNVTTSEWIQDNEINCLEGTYVNLQENSEAYTGYQGQHVWNAIFRENCFADKLNSICTEEKVFYRVFSGLLSNINIQLSSNYYDQNRNISYINISMFNERFADHPERVDNLFFLFSLLVKSFNKAEYVMRNAEIFTGNQTEDQRTMRIIDSIYTSDAFQELSSSCEDNSEELNKFLNFNKMDQMIRRFRNISSIIECVSCQKCKLHGKLQLYGIATMLKILFDRDYSNLSEKNVNLKLTRNEVISFVNLFGKVAKSINNVRKINENIKYSHFVYKFKFFFIFFCYMLIFIYINFFFMKKKKVVEKVKTKIN